MPKTTRQILVIVAVAAYTAAGQLETIAEPPTFARDVLPILSENCFFCHGPDEGHREGDLRLDTEESAIHVLSRDDPHGSELLRRVISADSDEVMPPVDSNRRLSAADKRVIQRWIETGSQWGKHWSFEPLSRPDVPDPSEAAQSVHNPIDSFVQHQLAGMGLAAAPEADRNTLIRRVSLDLTGLPPTPSEIRDFLADESPDAYEKVVDRLLNSSAYGERMAWDWLDAARYADSNGYQGDRERTMWPWRDWVVAAFNTNLPFDQFTIYQLAGDLLPDATEEQRLATGFCRNHMINGEGGRIAEENRVDYVMDMTETMGTVWLGLTLNCCRCHDHKYDPLQQKEYYQFFAYFNQTPVTGGGGDPQTAPKMAVPTVEQQQAVQSIDQQLEQLNTSLKAATAKLVGGQPAWEQQLLAKGRSGGWTRLHPTSHEADHQTLRRLPDDSVLAEGDNPANDTYRIAYALSPGKIAALRLTAIRHSSMTKGGLARSDSGNFVLTEAEFELRKADGSTRRLTLESSKATFEQGPWKVRTAHDGDSRTGWAVYQGRPIDRDHAAMFSLSAPMEVMAGDVLHVTLRHDSQHPSHNLGRFAVAITSNSTQPLIDADEKLPAIAQLDEEERNAEQRASLRAAYLNEQPEYVSITTRQTKLIEQRKKAESGAPQVMIMTDQPGIRKSYILERGLYNQPTEVEVVARTPVSLPGINASKAGNRLDLARWLVSDEQPLTARVTVNRFWQQLFGIGLVKTTEDFGVQGEYPTYLSLLDWLAADFRDGGWDVKRLVKTIVMSHTYRQSSKDRSVTDSREVQGLISLTELDPLNRLLARGARARMPAWMLRDQALSISGLLNRKKGGPSVNTYQPAGVWEEATFGKKKYQQGTGDQLYRRSLYVFWRRIIGPTMFFDNASRQVCSVKVLRTNTPLHSLLTLNETTYVECARVLAESVLLDVADSDSERIRSVFQRVLSRSPTEEELSILQQSLHRSVNEYQGDRESAVRLLSVGESARDESISAELHAAWTSLCLTLLNLDETLTRE